MSICWHYHFITAECNMLLSFYFIQCIAYCTQRGEIYDSYSYSYKLLCARVLCVLCFFVFC
jgi:hypothetical protein